MSRGWKLQRQTVSLPLVLGLLVLGCLVLGLRPVVGEDAALAILVVGEGKAPAAEARERMLFRSLQEARGQAGLTRADLPIISYHFDKPAERAYCEKHLKIRASALMFVGLVEHRSLVAQKVRFRLEQVTDAENSALRTVEQALKVLGRAPGGPVVAPALASGSATPHAALGATATTGVAALQPTASPSAAARLLPPTPIPSGGAVGVAAQGGSPSGHASPSGVPPQAASPPQPSISLSPTSVPASPTSQVAPSPLGSRPATSNAPASTTHSPLPSAVLSPSPRPRPVTQPSLPVVASPRPVPSAPARTAEVASSASQQGPPRQPLAGPRSLALLSPKPDAAPGLQMLRVSTVDYEGRPRGRFGPGDRGVYVNVFVRNTLPASDQMHWLAVRCFDPQGRPYGRVMGGSFRIPQGEKTEARDMLQRADPRHHNGFLIYGNEMSLEPGAYTLVVEIDGQYVGQGGFTVAVP